MYSQNFSGELARRCRDSSRLINAKTGEIYSDIEAHIALHARRFTLCGLKPGERVVIVSHLTPATAVAYLGAIYAGLVAVPLDATNLSELINVVELTGAHAVWSEIDNDWSHELPAEVKFIHGNPEAGHGLPPPVSRALDDLAVLMLTSGSTGTPRFVKVTHANLLSNTESIVKSQHLGGEETAMLILPVSYCFGASVLHSHLFCGGSVVFDSRFMFPDKVLKSIAEYECTTFAGVPSVFKILLKRSSLATISMPELRRVLQAGGHLEWQYIEQFTTLLPDVPFYVMYGQTEATARITCLEPGKLYEKKGSVGLPLENLKLRIVDESGNALPPLHTGAIQVSGPSICPGYWNDPEETIGGYDNGWLDTNDYGKVDEEGYLWIEGRNADFLKVRGKRLSFGEIEKTVAGVPGVHDVAVCPVVHEEAGEAPALFIVPDVGVNGIELTNMIRNTLPPAWTCERIVLIDHLPVTDRGKLNRKALKLLLDNQ